MSGMERRRLQQVNVVVRDMDAMVAFYRQLGVDVPEWQADWDAHHRNCAVGEGLDLDLDSAAFARYWGAPAGFTGALLSFSFASPEDVDTTYAQLVDAGHEGARAPFDAFWGARFAVVVDPDGNAVGLMGPVDRSRGSMPPLPS